MSVTSETVELDQSRANVLDKIEAATRELAVLISKVWTTANDSEDVREASEEVLTSAKDLFSDISEEDAYPVAADKETRKFVTHWFDPQARRQLAALAACIDCVSQ
jgi:hypothetical protein